MSKRWTYIELFNKKYRNKNRSNAFFQKAMQVFYKTTNTYLKWINKIQEIVGEKLALEIN